MKAPSHWPKDMRDDFESATAPRESDYLDEDCVICGEKLKTGWHVERVDILGDRIWGGYVCSTACMRKAPSRQRTDVDIADYYARVFP